MANSASTSRRGWTFFPTLLDASIRRPPDLYGEIKGYDPKYVSTETKKGYAFPVKRDTKFCLIADIDALLFELNSCWELMRKLFQDVRAHVGRPIVGKDAEEVRKNVSAELRAVLGTGSDRWFSWLDKQRNFVAHEGTPYLAIDVTDDRPDFLVMKENLTTFVDTKKFFRHSELIEATRGIIATMQALRKHLVELFDHLKSP